MLCRKLLCIAVLTMGFAGNAMAQEGDDVLTIGSKAPSLDIETWISDGNGKFGKVTEFEEGKIYMVEFWATWCGPCIASMPHLAELQNEYADKGVQIISVSDEDMETIEGFLERKVRGEDEKTYQELTGNWCLTTDPDGSVQDDYMRAAGQNGIPTAFVVGKTGLIEWIGHPMEIDEPIEKIVNDSWDREEFAVAFKAQQEAELMMMKLSGLMQQGKTEEAITMLDETIEKLEDGPMKEQLAMTRSQIVIMTGAEGAADEIRKLAEANSDNPQLLNSIAWTVVGMHDADEDVSDDMIEAAYEAAQAAMAAAPEDGSILDTVAHLAYIKGDLDKAIEIQKKAVELDGDDMPELGEFLKMLEAEKSGGDEDGDGGQ